MCIGNRNGGDDSVGPYIADKLKKIKNRDFLIIDCGTIPENYTSIVKNNRSRNLILIDAVEMGLKPGDIRIIPSEKIGIMHISTHNIPLSVLSKYLEPYADNIILIGIQPKRLSGKISEPARKSANRLSKIIKNGELKKLEKFQ